MEYLEYTIRQTSVAEDLLDLLGTRWCLGRRLDDYRITGQQRRNKRIYEGQVWILQGSQLILQ